MKQDEDGNWIVTGEEETYSLLPCIDCTQIEGDDGHNDCIDYKHCEYQIVIGLPLKYFLPDKEARLRWGTDNRLKEETEDKNDGEDG